MSIEGQLSADLKTAMLAGQQQRVTTLRGLKSSLLYAKVAKKGPRDQELPDAEVLDVLARESKKRQESADLYKQGGSQEKAEAELAEKAIIDNYLPKKLSDDEVKALVEDAIKQTGATGPQQMGVVIGKVKQQAGVAADGAMIAKLVKERLAA